MLPYQWLGDVSPEFSELGIEERDAIASFTFLWSLFESKKLGTQGNIRELCRFVRGAADNENLLAECAAPFQYFQNRYSADADGQRRFENLWDGNREREHRQRCLSVLHGAECSSSERLLILLMIVYRLRNNLFHGSKWAYGLRGQLDNFCNANLVLQKILSFEKNRQRVGA